VKTTEPGRILVLQGPSSAGKSTLARQLQVGLEEYWWRLEADDITAMQPVSARTEWWSPTPEERPHPSWKPEVRLERWLAGYFECIATIARTGSNVIAVGAWIDEAWLFDLAGILEGLHALCVGVHCPLEELERREVARGDRHVGYSREHFDVVLAHAPHDLEVNTFTQSWDEIVGDVRALLAAPPEETFFERIRMERLL